MPSTETSNPKAKPKAKSKAKPKAKKPTPKANGTKPTLHICKRFARRLNNIIGEDDKHGLRKLHHKSSKWKKEHDIDKAATHMAKAIEELRKASDILDKVPKKFVPYYLGSAPKVAIEVGMKVRIQDNKREGFDEVFEPEEMDAMLVVGAKNSKEVYIRPVVEGEDSKIRVTARKTELEPV